MRALNDPMRGQSPDALPDGEPTEVSATVDLLAVLGAIRDCGCTCMACDERLIALFGGTEGEEEEEAALEEQPCRAEVAELAEQQRRDAAKDARLWAEGCHE